MTIGTITVTPTSPTLSSPITGPRPLQLLDNNISNVLNSPVSVSALPSPRASSLGLSTPPHSARTFSPRRQSSISYFSTDHVRSPSSRSPTAPGTSFNKPSPRRSNSVGVWGGEGASGISRTRGDRRSMGALTGNAEPLSPGPVVDHGPLTLTEKHAELLQFIAQKEAKCLELRSQLTTHEAELLQLKRKWERIVSRGMDRAYSSPGTTTSPASGASVSSIIPTAGAAFKEGARLLAAGLDLSAPGQATEATSAATMVSPIIAPMSGFATVSRAAMASSPAMKRATSRHETTQSMSSVSTTTSSSTRTSTTQSSQRLSQSSASSLLSSLSLEDPIEESSVVDATLEDPTVSCISSPTAQTAQSVKLMRRRSQDVTQTLARSPLSPSPLSLDAKKHFDSLPTTGKVKPRPASMALINSPVASLPTPVSAWMGSVGSSVGRKWEEIQKGEAFTKSQKRASLLLSDVSQSFFAALASPTPSGAPSPLMKSSPLSATNSHSLLDDESEQLDSTTSTLDAMPVLVPSIVSPSPVLSQQNDADDDDDWNW